jgi:hypothetical protein
VYNQIIFQDFVVIDYTVLISQKIFTISRRYTLLIEIDMMMDFQKTEICGAKYCKM